MWTKGGKRCFDFILALGLSCLFFWLFLLVWLGVRIFLGAPALFQQERIGWYERKFIIYKFRTMTDQRDTAGTLLPDQQRLTGFGKFLRATSLDELPQLWNILIGQMSFVGPRPLLVEYLPLYNIEQKKRHHVRPGITGWAQVNGRNRLSWQEKFQLDCWYVAHQSIQLDIRIMWLTFLKVVQRDGISQQGQATMEKFNGRN